MTTADLAALLGSIASFRIAADRASRALHTSMSGADPQSSGALHRLHVVLNDAVTAIDHLRTSH